MILTLKLRIITIFARKVNSLTLDRTITRVSRKQCYNDEHREKEARENDKVNAKHQNAKPDLPSSSPRPSAAVIDRT